MATEFKYIDRGKLALAVLLPGWAADHRVFTDLDIEYNYLIAENIDIDDFFECLEKNLSWGKAIIIGWSFGGILAAHFMVRYPDLVRKVILIGVKSEYPEEEIQLMIKYLRRNMKTYLKSFYRKCLSGSKKEEINWFTPELLNEYLQNANMDKLISDLKYLKDNPLPIPDLKKHIQRVLFIHGEKDRIVPIKKVIDISNIFDPFFKIVSNAGHLAFLPAGFSDMIETKVKKDVIEKNFSKSAAQYDKHSKVQSECAKLLSEKIEGSSYKSILEIGCGTGTYTSYLESENKDSKITSIDISDIMINIAKSKVQGKNLSFLHCDGESLPKNEKYDLITSNASFQWFENMENAVSNMHDLLRKNGIICFSSYGPGTFKELQEVLLDHLGQGKWISAGRFINKTSLRNIITKHFKSVEVHEETFKLAFNSLIDLLKDIKLSGARGGGLDGNVFMGKELLGQMQETYLKKYGGIIATHQVYFIKALKG